MNQRQTHCEDLPPEIFGLIFAYLAPHDLLRAFSKLNCRLERLVEQHPLSLPNNRSMSYALYSRYLTEIVPKRLSQMAHVHLSERYGPYAVRHFMHKLPIESDSWPALRAVTIEDVPEHVFEALLIDSSFLPRVQSLTLDIGDQEDDDDAYEGCNDVFIVTAVLHFSPELRSLSLNLPHQSMIDEPTTLNQHSFPVSIHRHLQILSIKQCSSELLIALLENGCLPQLRRLNASISCECHVDKFIDSPSPMPLQQANTPELRHVRINLFARGVNWVLTFFEDLQRHQQLEYFSVSGRARFTHHNHFPRVAWLRQWLTLNKSPVFRFRMKLDADYVPGAESVREEVFEDYRRATGEKNVTHFREINVRYPEMSFSYPTMMKEASESSSDESMDEDDDDDDDDNEGYSSKLNQWCRGEPLDKNMEEFVMIEDDYAHNGLFREIQQISCWHRLKRIVLDRHVFAGESYTVGCRLDRFAHLIRCAPHLREFDIVHDLDYAAALAAHATIGTLLASKLDVFAYSTTLERSSLGDLARLVDALFSRSTAPPRLKELMLEIDGHPRTWLSIDHLVQWISQLIGRFPALTHFTLCCHPSEIYQDHQYSLIALLKNRSLTSLLSERVQIGPIEYRLKADSLDIWL